MAEYIQTMRQVIGHDLILLPTTAFIVLDEHDRVLMQCRSDNRMWCCPGGVLDIGETIRENALRELREETGLIADECELFGVFAGPDFFHTYPNGDRTAIVQTVFVTRRYSGTPRIDSESVELRFAPVDALPGPITQTHRAFLIYLEPWLRGELATPVVV